MKNLSLYFVLFFVSIVFSFGQSPTNEVSNLNTYFKDFSDELRGYRLALIGTETLTPEEKFKRYIIQKDALKEKFKKSRLEEYALLDGRKIRLSHSCTRKGGPTKDCGTLVLEPPVGYVKKPNTFSHSGKGSASETTTGAQIYMRKSGTGSDKGTISFDIELDKGWVGQKVKEETRVLFGDIVADHKKLYPDEAPYW